MLHETSKALDAIKNQLKASQDQGAAVKPDLYSHLTEVFNRIIQYHPYDAFDRFEEISTLVKETNFKIADPKFDYEVNGNANYQKTLTNSAAVVLIDRMRNLIHGKVDNVNPADRRLLTKNALVKIPNLTEESQMLEWAGVNFGDDVNFCLQKSSSRLGVTSGASSVKLFGRIYGT